MPRTLKTLLEDVYTYFVVTPYPVGKRDNSCFAILDNCVVEVTVEEDCSEFAIIFNKRVDKDHHIAWARFSRDNYKEANKYFDFLIETKTDVKYVDLQFATVHKEALTEAYLEKALKDFQNSPDVIVFMNPDGKKSYTVKRKVYYVWGTSRCGKTNGVIRKHGEEDVSDMMQKYQAELLSDTSNPQDGDA